MKKSTPLADVEGVLAAEADGKSSLLPASEMIDRELVALALESHARALMYPDSEIQHDRANECANEILKRLVRDDAKKFLPLVTQLCRDLNEAHNEILRLQNVSENDFGKWDWPEWSPQANSIRWAERILQGRLAKTIRWTLFPPLCRCPPDHCLLHSSQTTCSVRERPPLAVQPSICGAEGAECQIAKVIPVGDSYSVAIGSLGIKMFETLKDAVEVRDAINNAIAFTRPSSVAEGAEAMKAELIKRVRAYADASINVFGTSDYEVATRTALNIATELEAVELTQPFQRDKSGKRSRRGTPEDGFDTCSNCVGRI